MLIERLLMEMQGLVGQFLDQASPAERRSYAVRDNCGPAALDMMSWANKRGIQLTRVSGYFVADHVVSSKNDFTPDMRRELIAAGMDFNNAADRLSFIEQRSAYKDEWKKIPHYWLVDSDGNIYDPSGYMQFVKTGLAADLDNSRYLPQ